MCSSSVAPMPSISSMPVASRHSVRVATGSASPAETHLRSVPPCAAATRRWRAVAAIARYEVGAVNNTVAPWRAMPSSRSGGEVLASSTVAAPTCIGNSSSPPSPKVKASGGLPMNTSSAWARSTCGGKQAQAAIRSR